MIERRGQSESFNFPWQKACWTQFFLYTPQVAIFDVQILAMARYFGEYLSELFFLVGQSHHCFLCPCHHRICSGWIYKPNFPNESSPRLDSPPFSNDASNRLTSGGVKEKSSRKPEVFRDSKKMEVVSWPRLIWKGCQDMSTKRYTYYIYIIIYIYIYKYLVSS